MSLDDYSLFLLIELISHLTSENIIVKLLTALAKGVFMYEDLEKRLIKSLHKFGDNNSDRKLNDSVRGEKMVMTLISKNGGSTYPKNIQEAMGISSARVAKIFNNLEAKNLITREADKKDKRKTLVSLTENGNKYVSLEKQKMDFAITTMFELLGNQDSEDFVRIIEKIENNLPEIKKLYKEKFGDLENDKDS